MPEGRFHFLRGRAIRIVILTSTPAANVYLVNRLLERHDVIGMIVESPPLALTLEEKRARRRRMVQRHGMWRTLNKLLLNKLRSRFMAAREAHILREELYSGGRPIEYDRHVPLLTVPSVNDPAAAAFIDELAPDLLAVCGTGVIKPNIFRRAPLGAVNIHTGITPEYRSADPILWALYDGKLDKVGVTIHFVDEGIDTGAIIHQESVPIYSSDCLAAIQARCIRRGAELYLRALREIADGSVHTSQRTHVAGKSYRSVDFGLLQHLVLTWRLRRLRRQLPSRPSVPASAECGP